MKTLQEMWHSLTGGPGHFSMEHRAFNAILLIALSILLVSTVGNIAFGLYTLGLVTLISSLLLLAIYYFARFRKNFSTPVLIFSIFSYLVVGATFFMNSGTEGPVVYLFFATFFMLLVVTPKQQQALWFSAHLLIGSLLFYVEYHFPERVPYTYTSRDLKYLDLFFSFILTLLFVWALINYLRKNYTHEKNLAEKRAEELQGSNKIIQEQNTQMKALNDEKDQLFSIISHDLRSPISSIKGLLQIMNDESISPAEKREIEDDLLKLTNNTYVLLENLLHWSSQKVKGTGQDIMPLPLSGPIEETIELLGPSARAKNLKLEISGTPEIKVLGNPEMLSIVVRNLLSNAIKFTPENGHVEINCAKNAEYASLIVKNSGQGIPKEKQKSLFEGRQTSSYGTHNESGAGLGLVLCREYVHRMNGTIDFKSEQNKGTEFRVKLPVFLGEEDKW